MTFAGNKAGGGSEVTATSSSITVDGVTTNLATGQTQSQVQAEIDARVVPGIYGITVGGVYSKYAFDTSMPANLIPVMTSATEPAGAATASSNFASNPPWYGFTPAQVGWLSANSSVVDCWLKYDFGDGNPKTALSYAFAPWSIDNYGARQPSSWKLQGSNDDSDWVDLDARTSPPPRGTMTSFQSFRGAWLPVCFNVTTPGSYRYYRIKILGINSGSYVGIVDFRLHASLYTSVPNQ